MRTDSSIREVLRLAWPAALSFVLNNLYRVTDQYWVQFLGGEAGPDAQAAIGTTTFILIANFSVFFVVVGGTMPLVARAVGAADVERRDEWIRHSLVLGVVLALALSVAGRLATPWLVATLGLDGGVAEQARAYLGTLYTWLLPLALMPVVDNLFVALGNTRVPLALQGLSVTSNIVLNWALIYGAGPLEPRGIAGAALATSLSRGVSAAVGLVLLAWLWRVRLRGRLSFAPALAIVRKGVPAALSILAYAGVYWLLIRLVVAPLGRDVQAGLGLGFNAFEGMAFPVYLGVAIAGASMVGRYLGAGRPDAARAVVASLRRLGLTAGVVAAVVFLVGGPYLAPLFSDDPGVVRETVRYVRILAFSQIFVTLEIVHERVLLGAGHTRPIFWVSVPLNALRVPLAWLLAFPAGMGAAGVWWAINISSLAKCAAYTWLVHRGRWVEEPRVRPSRVAG